MSLYDSALTLINGTFVVAVAGAVFYYFGYFYSVEGDDKNKYVYGFLFFLENVFGHSIAFFMIYGFGYMDMKMSYDSVVVSLHAFLSSYIDVCSLDKFSQDIGFLIFILMNIFQLIVFFRLCEYQEILSSTSDNLIKWRVRKVPGYRDMMSHYAFYCSFAVIFVGLFYGVHSDSNMYVYLMSNDNSSILSSDVESCVIFLFLWSPLIISFLILTIIARFKGTLNKVYNDREWYEESLIGYV